MKDSSFCPNCESPNRVLWVLFGEHRKPALEALAHGNWNSLCHCSRCAALWVVSHYEPYASFGYAVYWPRDVQSWNRVNALEKGRTILGWHAFMIVKYCQQVSIAEQESIVAYRSRSRGHNPIDNPDAFAVRDLPENA